MPGDDASLTHYLNSGGKNSCNFAALGVIQGQSKCPCPTEVFQGSVDNRHLGRKPDLCAGNNVFIQKQMLRKLGSGYIYVLCCFYFQIMAFTVLDQILCLNTQNSFVQLKVRYFFSVVIHLQVCKSFQLSQCYYQDFNRIGLICIIIS